MSESKESVHIDLDFAPMIAALEKMSQEVRRAGFAMHLASQPVQRNLNRMQRHWRKAEARDRKRQAIEARQVARAVVIVNRVPALIHRGKAAR